MIKSKVLCFVILSLVSTKLFSQNIEFRDTVNYIPGLADKVPEGATGPGVIYTSRTIGKVIAIGAPVTKNYAVGNTCQNNELPIPSQNTVSAPSLNMGTVAGAIIGSAIASRFGGGTGKDIMMSSGAVIGAATGSDIVNNHRQSQVQQTPQCQTIFENRVVGYTFVAQYHHIQVQGFMRRQPQIGEDVEIIVRSAIYAGS